MKQKHLQTTIAGVLALVLGCAWALADEKKKTDAKKEADSEGKWIQLFNGKDLDGWTPKIRFHKLGENFGNTFRVKGGAIQTGYEAHDEFKERFGHLFYDGVA